MNATATATAAGLPSRTSLSATTLPYACQRCGRRHQLSKTDPVKCLSCNHRILYKVRTTHSVVIEVD